MTDPLEFSPGYVSPLTDKEHATIGRIALLWGQIEHFVDELLPEISGLSREQLEALQVKEKPMASKVSFLKASAKRHNHEPTSQSVAKFCGLVEDTKMQRNHIFHGIWGWRGDDRTERVYPAARKESDPHSPFAAEKLPGLEKKLCKCSRLGFDLVARVSYGQLQRPHPSRFFHHSSPADPQGWLMQWTKHNPWGGDGPDYIEKAGQLPRRYLPYPER